VTAVESRIRLVRGGVREEGPRRWQAAAAERSVMLRHPAHVKAQLIGDDKQLLRVAVGGGQVAPALHVGEEAKPERRLGWLLGHGCVFHESAPGRSGSAENSFSCHLVQ
jgi:hypothetical protein